jgi:hypothetical protein
VVLLALAFGLFTRSSAATLAAPATWSEGHPDIAADVRAGAPFVTLVYVPLCNNAQIDCGGKSAGDPSALDKNLYWGRGFGVRRFLNERPKTWELVTHTSGSGDVLEEVVYRRRVAAARWGLEQGEVEQLLMLRAVHGDAIDQAVDAFWKAASQGSEVSFEDGGKARRVRVHVTGYAGHNRLMDGKELPPPPPAEAGKRPWSTPSFVLACRSEPYFSRALATAGSRPLVMTRDLMAPEGYLIDALVRGLGDNVSTASLRQRVVETYAKWQRIPVRTASTIFAK